MEVNFTPETERKLKDVSAQSGRRADELIEEAVAGYLAEEIQMREMLDARYDDLAGGRVEPIDGEGFFEELRRREDDLLRSRSRQ